MLMPFKIYKKAQLQRICQSKLVLAQRQRHCIGNGKSIAYANGHANDIA